MKTKIQNEKKNHHFKGNLEYFVTKNFSGIRRRENQREGFRRAMAEKEKNKKEFEEWHQTTRAAEAEKTSKVSIRLRHITRGLRLSHHPPGIRESRYRC